MDIDKIVSHILSLKPTELLRFRCVTESEANGLRLRLGRKKNALMETNPDVARRIQIVYSRANKLVEVKMMSDMVLIEKIDANGCTITVDDDLEKERIARLMREDGKSEEEIANVLGSLTS